MQIEISFGRWLATLAVGAAVVAALGVGVALLRRRTGSRLANVSLGGLLVVAALAVFYVLLLVVQPPGENLGVVLAPLPFTLSLGPLLYAYVRARLGMGAPGAVHWVLPLAQAAVVLGIGLGPMAWKAWYAANVFFPWWVTAQAFLVAMSLGLYLALSTGALRASAAIRATTRFAWAVRRDRWLRDLLVGVAVSAAAVAVADVALPVLTGSTSGLGVSLSLMVYAAVLVVAVRAGLVQAGWLRVPGLRPEAARPAAPDRSPAADAPDDALAAHADALAAHVRAEKPYLDPDLTLASLAAQLGITDKTLSAVLNATAGGYADYVNRLRVDEAQRRLHDPDHAHLSVLAVGLDAGFASKSTFNRVFKERTGQTPSAYRARAAA